MYWRRFAVSSIPLTDAKEFDNWLLDRWREKDDLLERWHETGRFPADADAASLEEETGISKEGYIETEMTLNHWMEIGQIFVVLATSALVVNVVLKFTGMFVKLK
jgi:hypothetical protein